MQAARHAGLASLSHSCIIDSISTDLRVFMLLKRSRLVVTDSSCKQHGLCNVIPSFALLYKFIIGSGLKDC